MSPELQQLDGFTLSTLVMLGGSPAQDREEIAERLRNSLYLRSRSPDISFSMLHELSWDEVCRMIKGLTLAEVFEITNHRGSVSLVKRAFRIAERRDPVAAMSLAAWIIEHSENPYIPFEMCKIRYAFARIRGDCASWEECRKRLNDWVIKEHQRQQRLTLIQKQRHEFARTEKQSVLEIVRNRCNRETQRIQSAKSDARRMFLEELARLSAKERLEHIAWDDKHPVGFYPMEFFNFNRETVAALAFPTRERLRLKLSGRRKHLWRRLYEALSEFDEVDTPASNESRRTMS